MNDESNTYVNAPLAFGLVCACGAATALGSAVVFFPQLVKLASQRVLAASLGFSAGVMTYVSFVEILRKSVVAFTAAGWNEAYSYVFATSSFFGGVLLMKLIDFGVNFFVTYQQKDDSSSIQITHGEGGVVNIEDKLEEDIFTPHCMGCAEDPIAELKEWHKMADEAVQQMEAADGNSKEGKERTKETCKSFKKRTTAETAALGDSVHRNSESDEDDDLGDGLSPPTVASIHSEVLADKIYPPQNTEGRITLDDCLFDKNASLYSFSIETSFQPPPPPSLSETKEKKRLVKMGLSAALAIGLHNIPEGLATFVATLEDPRVGAVLAIAITMHNIPEGMCVAFPIYYATGDRLRAFKWGCLSGVFEPLAAALGWLVLANFMNKNVYGVLYGWTSGMMVIISLKELIPTAHRYDPKDTVVTNSLMGGMFLIALSLVLFRI